MKYPNMKMLSCSNPNSVGMREVGNTGPLAVGNIFIFGDIYSSDIQSMSTVDDKLTITTLNTVYVFEPIPS